LKACTASLGVVVLVLLGCGGPRLTWQQKMNSSAGVERAQAVMVVGERKMWAAIPQVINRLEDDDVSVRVLAIHTLRDMTGSDFGYSAYAPERERREAVARWRSWWETEGKTGTVKRPPTAGGTS
jgi:hypothetical protein